MKCEQATRRFHSWSSFVKPWLNISLFWRFTNKELEYDFLCFLFPTIPDHVVMPGTSLSTTPTRHGRSSNGNRHRISSRSEINSLSYHYQSSAAAPGLIEIDYLLYRVLADDRSHQQRPTAAWYSESKLINVINTESELWQRKSQ